MRKISKANLENMESRGVSVRRQPRKPVPPAVGAEPIADNGLAAAIKTQTDSNKSLMRESKAAIEVMTDNLERYLNQRKNSWKHTVKRNKQGSITHVISDPVK